MYYKHKDLDHYVMISPVRIIKTYKDSVIQYTRKDYCFKLESDINTDIYQPIPAHDFWLAFIQIIDILIETHKTYNDAEITIN
jgi:hypothetical protein